MKLIHDRKFEFMAFRKVAMGISLFLVAASLFLILFRGLNLGIDYTGGTLLQVEFPAAVSVGQVREALGTVGQEQAVIQSYSDRGMIIRLKAGEETVGQKAREVLREKFGEIQVLRLEKVGPVVGRELTRGALIALCLALLGILIYVSVRFQFRFAAVSVIALAHDAIVVTGAFALTGREISLTYIAAILTVVGYSINDTIVVLDRVRENWGKLRQLGIERLLDDSVNQTLSRTINTSLTTLLPVIALFLFGGPVIADFSFALLVGLIVGTYSSIFVAGALLCEWFQRSPR
ncbi:MAG: protein translocase subunit SecF [Synergistaceae bacterium]|nr:protein translocase subunit SecF [Synergistaceae bacterium]